LDIRARIAGCQRVERRLKELVDGVGRDFFLASTKQMVEDAAAEARSMTSRLKPGVYNSRIYIDNAGLGHDKLAIVQLELEVTKDGDLIFNFPIVSPQAPGPNNSYLPGIESQLMVVMLTRMFYNLRWNTGVTHPTKLNVIPHSRINADPKMSVALGVACITLPSAQNPLQESLSRALYIIGDEDEVDAPANDAAAAAFLAGLDLYGRPCINAVMSVDAQRGDGGKLHKDGIDSSVQRMNPWGYVSDEESEEILSPALWLTQRQLPDSGGFGKYRGGLSTYNMLMVHPKAQNTFSMSIGLGYKAPFSQGLFGGYPAATCGYTVCKDSGFLDRIKSGMPIPHDVEEIKEWMKGRETSSWMYFLEPNLKAGDVIMQVGLAGCGLGDPLERDPELIVEDIQNKMGTIDMARKVYRVAIDSKTLVVDHAGTEKMREEKRKERLKQGIPGRDYLKSMVEKRKKRELPKVALDFLDETLGFCPEYKEQLEAEEKMLKMDLKPIGKVKSRKDILYLSPYIKIVEDEKGRKVVACRTCGFGYCDASENFKLYCLVYERDPAELQVGFYSYDKDWCIYREFYCPGCGTQVEVEATPPGTPILHSVRLKDSE
jgi:N-methylhydantoinase B/oxoprolinase/acetone carboxylase alpha subunit/acetone carboxylase gamma subunit